MGSSVGGPFTARQSLQSASFFSNATTAENIIGDKQANTEPPSTIINTPYPSLFIHPFHCGSRQSEFRPIASQCQQQSHQRMPAIPIAFSNIQFIAVHHQKNSRNGHNRQARIRLAYSPPAVPSALPSFLPSSTVLPPFPSKCHCANVYSKNASFFC